VALDPKLTWASTVQREVPLPRVWWDVPRPGLSGGEGGISDRTCGDDGTRLTDSGSTISPDRAVLEGGPPGLKAEITSEVARSLV
jgi:hypothetical protein